MFPPQIPHFFIRWLTSPGDIVYDPFAGRGTAPMEACRLGRLGFGSDANPLAYILTAAKVDPPAFEEAVVRLKELHKSCKPSHTAVAPDYIRMLYAPEVLGQLIWLRDTLDLHRRDDRFLMALLLGIMHANYEPGRLARGLSISMPNTFSMSPKYVKRYIEEHRLIPPEIDVFDLMGSKLRRMQLPGSSGVRGKAWQQDACQPIKNRKLSSSIKLVFTSPPYLSVVKYGKYNWIRLWMLKETPKDVDLTLMTTSSRSKYIVFFKTVLQQLRPMVRDDGYVCVMVGDVTNHNTGNTLNLAECVWEEAARPFGWNQMGIIPDQLPTEHKVSRIWKSGRGRATKTDRILILSHNHHHSSSLPTLPSIRWDSDIDWKQHGGNDVV